MNLAQDPAYNWSINIFCLPIRKPQTSPKALRRGLLPRLLSCVKSFLRPINFSLRLFFCVKQRVVFDGWVFDAKRFFVKTILTALRSPKFQACHLFGVKVETGTYLFPIEAELTKKFHVCYSSACFYMIFFSKIFFDIDLT